MFGRTKKPSESEVADTLFVCSIAFVDGLRVPGLNNVNLSLAESCIFAMWLNKVSVLAAGGINDRTLEIIRILSKDKFPKLQLWLMQQGHLRKEDQPQFEEYVLEHYRQRFEQYDAQMEQQGSLGGVSQLAVTYLAADPVTKEQQHLARRAFEQVASSVLLQTIKTLKGII